MITPDNVRGEHTTLEESVVNNGWPTLAEARGKVVFLMDQRPVGPVYLEGHPSLRGRVIFTNAQPGEPDCGFIEENDGTPEVISALVQKGYLIRTRTTRRPWSHAPTKLPSATPRWPAALKS